MSAGRTFAIGDIHGCDVALGRLLERIEPAAEDRVILLGDLCDRGPNTRRVIEMLIDLSSRCQLLTILGNHDEMMLAVFGRLPNGNLNFWWNVGGSTTIESYGGDPGSVPDAHLDFLESAVPYVESDREIFVHASVDESLPLSEQSFQTLRWDKISGSEPPHLSGRRVICGHTSQRSGWPLQWDGWLCLDTRVYDTGGWLTALDVDANVIHQANQDGDVRGPISLGSIRS